jgi:hypothetical protein
LVRGRMVTSGLTGDGIEGDCRCHSDMLSWLV